MRHAPFGVPFFSPYMDPSRRKNATREATKPLKQWLAAHRKSPYPNKGDKMMLTIMTGMTLTQVHYFYIIYMLQYPFRIFIVLHYPFQTGAKKQGFRGSNCTFRVLFRVKKNYSNGQCLLSKKVHILLFRVIQLKIVFHFFV